METEKTIKDKRTAVERVRELLEANRSLITQKEYEASRLTLQAVELAQEEIKKEK